MASKSIQWHPGFYAGMELDLRGNALEFEKEFQSIRIKLKKSGRFT